MREELCSMWGVITTMSDAELTEFLGPERYADRAEPWGSDDEPDHVRCLDMTVSDNSDEKWGEGF